MASSLGVGCGGSNGVCIGQKLSGFDLGSRPISVAMSDRSVGRRRLGGRLATVATKAMVVATSSMDLEAAKFDDENRRGGETTSVEACERLDEWMKKSVVEIVKNLKEAPLLVQVYQDQRGDRGAGTRKPTWKTEKKAVEEDWTVIKRKWETGETPLPDGLIFVEEISSDELETEDRDEISGGGRRRLRGNGGMEKTTRAWGIVVQGKGMGCGPICYLLKTCRVGSGSGLGLYCTHFCLVPVKNFRETAHSQLKNCWLLQSLGSIHG